MMREPVRRLGSIAGVLAPLVLASLVLVSLVLLSLGGCGQAAGPGPSAPPGVQMGSITVTSKAFAPGGQIPVDYTCDGKNISPPLVWSAPPQGTKALAIILDDPDAPGGLFTHWIVFNLPGDALNIAEAVDPTTLGAKLGANDFHNVSYGGPCPPKGDGMHRYQFTVYALDAPLAKNEGANRSEIDAALAGHVLGLGTLVGGFGH